MLLPQSCWDVELTDHHECDAKAKMLLFFLVGYGITMATTPMMMVKKIMMLTFDDDDDDDGGDDDVDYGDNDRGGC